MTLSEAILEYHRKHVLSVDPLTAADHIEVKGDVWLEWVQRAEDRAVGLSEVATIEAALAQKVERQRDALRNVVEAMLLFYSGSPWSALKAEQWLALVGQREATTRALCDMAHEALTGLGGSGT